MLELFRENLIKHSEEIRQASLVGTIVIGMVLEGILPMRPVFVISIVRLLNNLLLTGFNYLLIGLWVPLIYGALASFSDVTRHGLLSSAAVGFGTSFALTFLTMEALGYAVHRLFHSTPVLWRLHAVHHSDTEVDVTTTERHHPIEVLISTCVTAPVMLLLGPDTAVIILYGLFYNVISFLSHSNIALNPKIDEAINWLLVTPGFHRVHHSSDKAYTDSNYGTICSLYDWVFGTAKRWSVAQQKTLQLGLEYMREPKATRFDQLMLMPWLIPLRR